MPPALKFTLLLALALSLGGCSTSGPRPEGAATATPGSAPHAWFTSRSATVVDITTLRIGRDESLGDDELEFTPENDFADRLASPLPANVAVSQIRDLASGVILASDGWVLTSGHVVSGADAVQVRLNDGRRFAARVIGFDIRTDVALIKIDAVGLPTAPIGDSSTIATGDWVAAIGAPFGFHGSVTTGVVSAKDRFIGGAGEIPFIQTDAVINPGSSGSPLFNDKGEVIAINSMIYSGSGGYMGLSFAVPINLAMKVAADLRAHGSVRRARLGADFQELTPALAQSFGRNDVQGALVVRVDPDGPADGAGLLRGDIVTRLDGVAVVHFSDLVRRIGERSAGARVRMEGWRRGAPFALAATLGEQTAPSPPRPLSVDSEWGDGLGLRLGEIGLAQRSRLRLDGGLLVRESIGAARNEGIRAGDMIVAINEVRVDRVEDFKRAVAQVEAGRNIALLVLRDRRLAYVAVRMPVGAGQ